MAIEMGIPDVDGLGEAVRALREWQDDADTSQLHPGDLGWYWRFGAEKTAASVRLWRRGREIVAVGLLDEPEMVRMGIAPDLQRDEELARQLVEDVSVPERDVLIDGKVYVEAPKRALVLELLLKDGWELDDPWVPVLRDLAAPVPDPGVRVEAVGPEQAAERTAVQRASFDGSTFTDERWHAMAAGTAYADARCLIARNDAGNAVAAVTVWSAGEDRPGYIEPMGVHREHRGHGYGTAITLAAARALQELGSSSVYTCTPAFNVGAVATYRAAGLEQQPDIRAVYRNA